MTSTYFLTISRLFGRLREVVSGIIPTVSSDVSARVFFKFCPFTFSTPWERDRWSCCRSPTAQFSWTKPDFLSSLPMDLSACGGKLTFWLADHTTWETTKVLHLNLPACPLIKWTPILTRHRKHIFFAIFCFVTTRNTQLISPDAPNEFSLFTDVSLIWNNYLNTIYRFNISFYARRK